MDAYVRPAEPARSSLHDLANGLAALDSGLGSFLGKRQEAQSKADRIRGEAAFNKANQMGWAEAVRQGLVPANASPVFMEAYKKSQGNLAGLQLRQKFRAEYLQWEGRNGNDPAAFQEFLGGFLQRNLADSTDPEVLAGLNPHIEALTTDAYGTFSEELNTATYNGALATNGAVATETIQGAEAAGLGSETGTDYDTMWEDLMAERYEALQSGVVQADYDKMLASTIIAEAKRSGNPALLKLLDRKLPGQEFAMSSFPEFRDLRDDALASLESAARQAEIDGDRRQAKIDKQRHDSIMVGITRTLAADPNAEIPEEVIKELERYDPNARTNIMATRGKLLEGEALEDPSDLLGITELVREGATEADLLQLVREGVIRSRTTYEAMLDRVEKYREARAKGGGIIAGQSAGRYRATIKDRTTPDEILSEDVFGARGLTEEGLQATQDFEWMLLDWEARNPNATLREREDIIHEAGKLVLQRIDRSNPGAPNYVSAGEATQRARETQRLLQEGQAPASKREIEAGPEPVRPAEPPRGTAPAPDLSSVFQDKGAMGVFGAIFGPGVASGDPENGLGMSPEDLGRMAGEAATAPPQAESARPQESTRGQPAPDLATVPDSAFTVDDLPDAERDEVLTGADVTGVSPEEYLKKVLPRLRRENPDLRPGLGALLPEQRRTVLNEARRLGVTPWEYLDAVKAKMEELRQEQAERAAP